MKCGNKKKQLQHHQNKCLVTRKGEAQVYPWAKEMAIIIIINIGIDTYSVKVTT